MFSIIPTCLAVARVVLLLMRLSAWGQNANPSQRKKTVDDSQMRCILCISIRRSRTEGGGSPLVRFFLRSHRDLDDAGRAVVLVMRTIASRGVPARPASSL